MKHFSKYILILTLTAISCKSVDNGNDLKLWYKSPAQKWVEALPVGNGRLGAMVFGNPEQERLQLNEETVWAGGPNNNPNPDALAALPEVRKLIFEQKYREAQDMATEKIMAKTNHGMSYQPVGDLNLAFAGHEKAENYYRELNLASAVATTRYTVDGVEYVREVFSSFTDQVIVMRISASKKGKLNFTANFTSPQKITVEANDNSLIMKGVSGNQENLEGKVKFTALAKIVPEKGAITSKGNEIGVSDADAVTIYISIATNFENYKSLNGNPDQKAQSSLQTAVQKDYKTLKTNHTAFYKQYFDRVTLDLGT
ncbi:MAG: glycoside hydrolase family 95 protein, partial [Prevotellaceae bacterium]|nr:glycoside hydrolase family 95 protein [Prevotellaceae bacterium]